MSSHPIRNKYVTLFYMEPAGNKEITPEIYIPTQKEKDLLYCVPEISKASDVPFEEGINHTRFFHLRGDGSAVFKPRKGEAELRNNIEPGTYYKRERAASLVSRFMDLGLVPATVIRTINNQRGSLQEFIPDAQVGFEANWEGLDDELHKLWIFDQIIYNSDRHEANFLVRDGKVYAIDNGLSFGSEQPRFVESFEGIPTPQDIVSKVTSFMEDQRAQNGLFQQLATLLSERDVLACQGRILQLRNIFQRDGFLRKPIPYFPNYQHVKSRNLQIK